VFLKHGMTMPEPWINPPVLQDQDQWYMDSFSELSTCRSFGFSTGPIPWTALNEYCELEEIEERDEFCLVMRSMDNAYLEYVKEKSEREAKTK